MNKMLSVGRIVIMILFT